MKVETKAATTDNTRVYLVDDDDDFRLLIEHWLSKQGMQVSSFQQAADFLREVDNEPSGVLLLDLHMPEMNGFELLEELRARELELPVIVLTASDTAQDAFQAVRLGAYDYLVKPVTREHLLARVRNAAERLELQQKVARLETELQEHQHFHEIIGSSDCMQKVFHDIGKVAPSSIPTYIFGESGTGKELIARAIHQASVRQSQPFLALNCAAIPDNLVESELFGHEKGAFTGATSVRKGCFERSHRGTLFLDEVGELDLSSQAKLLRVLQEGVLNRIGGSRDIKVDVRMICATNRDLLQRAEEGHFREDLYYRLAAFTLQVPPLRERASDIPLLVQSFFGKYQHEAGKELTGFSTDAMESMLQHHWPGNVRELENVVRSAMVVSDTALISSDALPARLTRRQRSVTTQTQHAPTPHEPTQSAPTPNAPTPNAPTPSTNAPAHPTPQARESEGPILPLAEVEKQAILRALRHTQGNIDKTATLLQIGRATLYRRISSYEDINVADFKQKSTSEER